MQLFRMRVESEGKNGLAEFVENHYISCGRPGIGDMSGLTEAELAAALVEGAGLDGSELVSEVEAHYAFAQVMQDGDYIIVGDSDRMYLGDLGDYYYLDDFDNEADQSGHRRGVTWLRSLHGEELQPELLAFLEQEGKLGMFGRAVSKEQLERLLAGQAPAGTRLVDEVTVQEALDILKAAMRSEDVERRERAAVAILQFARMERQAAVE
ncbi:hypothetical protein [Paenibacillus sp. CF384]|uniref:hypothetical protein n=1 Tax=Paenibacillus sp. CF384 TaxID=1884382 RepID=UPI000898E034|nr:hypothetical protein [Paenibacillus sp. CF384]SDX57034.1 hypothetical protein SAMN05518855_1016129 [Paenibacillus sp. CF384]